MNEFRSGSRVDQWNQYETRFLCGSGRFQNRLWAVSEPDQWLIETALKRIFGTHVDTAQTPLMIRLWAVSGFHLSRLRNVSEPCLVTSDLHAFKLIWFINKRDIKGVKLPPPLGKNNVANVTVKVGLRLNYLFERRNTLISRNLNASSWKFGH